MADNLVFEESVQTMVDNSEFISKKWVYVNDNNNGNYTSQTVIDTTPLANSGGYVGWSEGYIIMPLVMVLTGGGVVSTSPPTIDMYRPLWSVGLKNGFWQMLHSMTVEFNNQAVVQQTPFLNVFRSFKALTSYSLDDVLNHGSEIGFYPDSAGAWDYCLGDGTGIDEDSCKNGRGLSNNKIVFCQPDSEPLYSNPNSALPSTYGFNVGLQKRIESQGYYPALTSIVNAPQESQSYLMPLNQCDTTYRPHIEISAGVMTVKMFAKLRLKDLHDFFEKMPLLKGSTIRIYLNTNQSIVDFSVDANLNLLLNSSPSVNGGSTCPIMITSLKANNSQLPTGNYKVSLSIYRNNFTQQTPNGQQSPLNSCRLYAPVYKFTPIKEQQYLSMIPTKSVKYNDIFQYQFDNIGEEGATSTPFNFLVSNGISNIKSVLVVPFLAPSSNPCIGTTTSGISTLLSPFATSGATCDPITLTNFNILISGVNLFLNNEQYDWEAFSHELAQSNQLNGNLTTGLTSGLISQDDFNRGLRYYYGNCSRILPAEAGVSRSVQIVGTSLCPKKISLMVFVEFEREIQIDLTTGARIA